jgi:hypothetical protein
MRLCLYLRPQELGVLLFPQEIRERHPAKQHPPQIRPHARLAWAPWVGIYPIPANANLDNFDIYKPMRADLCI